MESKDRGPPDQEVPEQPASVAAGTQAQRSAGKSPSGLLAGLTVSGLFQFRQTWIFSLPPSSGHQREADFPFLESAPVTQQEL